MPHKPTDFTALVAYFDSKEQQVYSAPELAELQTTHRADWNLPIRMSSSQFIDLLLSKTAMSEASLECPTYPSLTRYSWGKPTALSIALSIKRGAYLSHGTALWIHGLGGDERNVFVNSEQGEKAPNNSALAQERIDRAFRNPQRQSKLIYTVFYSRITVLSGKHTARLEVDQTKSPSGEIVPVTSLERTLIDVAVRPAYAGGVSSVLRAFELARKRTSTQKLVRILEKLDYRYPYHQAIGFYLKMAGYSQEDQALLATPGLNLNFYLCHNISNAAFDKEWRIFFPKSLRQRRRRN